MSGRVIAILAAKDAALYFKNRFFAVITVLSLAVMIGAYFLMPAAMDDSLAFAIYAPVLPSALAQQMAAEGVAIESLPSEEALKAAVAGGDAQAGIVLPPDMTERIAAGERPQARLYLAANLPPEFGEVYQLFVRELGFMIGGDPLSIETQSEVLGPDLAGAPIPPRDRMLPMFAVFVLMMETLGLASLITVEVESGTLRALLVTPMRVSDLFAGKGLVGVGLAFGQAAVLTAVTGGLAREPGLVLAALLLGAALVTGLAFLIASFARDMLSVLGWGILVLLLLAIPGLALLLPGLASGWARLLPSYYLVDTMHRVMNFGAGWADVWPNLAILAGWAAACLALGAAVLRRRFA
jgi:ABC-2 type transport system permease protein